jgi:hypothetical protein
VRDFSAVAPHGCERGEPPAIVLTLNANVDFKGLLRLIPGIAVGVAAYGMALMTPRDGLAHASLQVSVVFFALDSFCSSPRSAGATSVAAKFAA